MSRKPIPNDHDDDLIHVIFSWLRSPLIRFVADSNEYTSSSGTKFPIKWAPPGKYYVIPNNILTWLIIGMMLMLSQMVGLEFKPSFSSWIHQTLYLYFSSSLCSFCFCSFFSRTDAPHDDGDDMMTMMVMTESLEVLWFTKFSSKSDVWAFGVLMWEVFTCGQMPYGRSSNAQVVEMIRQGQRLERPRICSRDMFRVLECCWQELPEKRPSFNQLQSKLQHILESRLDLLINNSN